jgi:hypothetical protein
MRVARATQVCAAMLDLVRGVDCAPAIEADASDPQLSPEFMRNLSQLGQVRVDHGMSTVRTRTQDAFRARATPGINAPTLAQLLGMRADGNPALGAQAKRVGLEPDALERVGRFVNAPRVRRGSERKWVDDKGVEHVEMEVSVVYFLIGFSIRQCRPSGEYQRRHRTICATVIPT